jgi:hypothetical protein
VLTVRHTFGCICQQCGLANTTLPRAPYSTNMQVTPRVRSSSLLMHFLSSSVPPGSLLATIQSRMEMAAADKVNLYRLH